jgi:hypothetical protein
MSSFERDAERPYRNDAEIETVVRGFESCACAPAEFKHRQHLLVAAYYLAQMPLAAAHERLRANLLRFLRHHAVDANVYHETVTLFWLRRVQSFVESRGTRTGLVELVNELLASSGGDAGLIHAYYSPERLASDEARTRWQEPDLKPLDF